MASRIKRFILSYLDFAAKHQFLTLAVVVLTVTFAAFTASHLKLKSSIKELLPDNTQSVKELNRLVDRMGGVGTLIVAVESPNVEANKRFMDDLAAKLAEFPLGMIRYVNYKADDIRKFYKDRFLYYIDQKDLKLLYRRLKQRVDYEKMKQTPFFLDFQEEGEQLATFQINDIKERNKKNYQAPLKTVGDYFGGEWGRMLIMMIRPYGASLGVESARKLVDRVEATAASLKPRTYDPRMRVGTCGNVKSTIEEYDTLKRDIASTALLCIALVAGVIVLYFLRLRVAFLLGATLLIAITWTFAITNLVIGYLNAQTAFLGSIIVGTGINYGIIQMGRYLEERKHGGREPREAMMYAVEQTIKPTFLAAATTAVSFAILLIARIKGLSQFGFIGAVGVMLCWVATIFVLPVMTLATERVRYLVRRKPTPKRASAVMDELSHIASKSPLVIVSFSIIIAAISFAVVWHFAPSAIEYDFSKMRNKVSVSTGTEALEKRVSKLFKNSMTPAAVLTDEPSDGPKICEAVKRQNDELPEQDRRVGKCYSIYNLLPKDQNAKLPVMRKIRALLKPDVVKKLDPKIRKKIRQIEKSLIGRPLTIDDLPADLTRHFDDLDGNRGAVVFINPRPGMLLSDGRNLLRFASTIRNIKLDDGRVFHAAGASLIYSELISIIKDEAPLLTVAALLGVIIFVIATLRRMSVSIVIVLSLMWAVLVMMGAAALLGIKINFFNFIVLPLTFGIGADYALNMAVRLREETDETVTHAIRHTGGAVALCSSTTIIGYFVLTRASNQALATFGSTAVIGEIACIIAAIAIVPAVIVVIKRHRAQRMNDQ